MKHQRKNLLWAKIWKSIAMLSALLGIVTATGQTFPISTVLLAIICTAGITVYWHLAQQIVAFFTKLSQDVTIIKFVVLHQRRRP